LAEDHQRAAERRLSRPKGNRQVAVHHRHVAVHHRRVAVHHRRVPPAAHILFGDAAAGLGISWSAEELDENQREM